jgi:hypothetical protein
MALTGLTENPSWSDSRKGVNEFVLERKALRKSLKSHKACEFAQPREALKTEADAEIGRLRGEMTLMMACAGLTLPSG